MKKLSAFACVAAALLFSSCSQAPKDLAHEAVEIMIEQIQASDDDDARGVDEDLAKKIEEHQNKVNKLSDSQKAEYDEALQQEIQNNVQLRDLGSLPESVSVTEFELDDEDPDAAADSPVDVDMEMEVD